MEGGLFRWASQLAGKQEREGEGDELPKEQLVDSLPELTAEGKVDADVSSKSEQDWEFLSDKHSSGTSQHGAYYVSKCGSVRSIASIENASDLSVPFKMQRTHSNSTIDSTDNAIGPSGKGVLGVDYVEHVVLPTDTLQGLCLAYKITATRLRQANHFSGNSLSLAPKKLVIPLSKKALRSGFIRVQDTDAKEYKLHAVLVEFPDMSTTEAKAYLELADWELKDAVRSARDDREWDKEIDANVLKSGQIRLTLSKESGFRAQGAGIPRYKQASIPEECEEPIAVEKPTVVKPLPRSAIPAIATKTIKAEDMYNAAPQHNNYGVELKELKPMNNT